MLKPIEVELLKSADELFKSDIKIEFDKVVDLVHENNENYQEAVKQNRVGNFIPFSIAGYDFIKIVTEKNLAIVNHCIFKTKDVSVVIGPKKYYQLPEPVYSHRFDFMIGPLSPYLDKFQEIMNIGFEVGLPIAWENFNDIFQSFINIKRTTKYESEEKILLDFDSILPYLLVLAFGFSIAFLALLCEIFHHDFLSQFTSDLFLKNFRSKIQKINVRRIKVQPKLK